jgi:tRNA-dihydrouridine synthase B
MIPLILAPMHDINSEIFMRLCKKYGADEMYSPMVNSKSYLYNPADFSWKGRGRFAFQLISNNALEAKECCQKIRGCDFIDLNAGCPSNDAIKAKSGAYLLNDLDNFKKILKTMVKYSAIPVSAKIRMGWRISDDSLKIAKIAQDCGAERLAVHARRYADGYSIKADWEAIARIKTVLKIPIIANGDIDSNNSAVECARITGADALMIGRAAMRNPSIFNEIKGEDAISKKILLMDFAKLFKKYGKGEFANFRKNCVLMCSGFKGASKFRDKFSDAKDFESVESIISLIE